MKKKEEVNLLPEKQRQRRRIQTDSLARIQFVNQCLETNKKERRRRALEDPRDEPAASLNASRTCCSET